MGAGQGKQKRLLSGAVAEEKATADELYTLKENEEVDDIGNECHRSELEFYARTRCDDDEIWLKFEDDKEKMPAQGYTDMKGNIVLANYLPDSVPSTYGDEELYLIISGVLEHETTHCRFYSREVHEGHVARLKAMQESGDDEEAKKAAVVQQLANVVLDGNNEEKLRALEPRAFRRISYLNKLWPRIPEEVWGKEAKNAQGEENLAGQMAAAIHAEAIPEFTTKGKDLHPKVKKVLAECQPIIKNGIYGTSEDVMQATDELYDILKKHDMLPDVNLIKQQMVGGDAQGGSNADDKELDAEAQAAGQEQDERGGSGLSDEELEDAKQNAKAMMKKNKEESEDEAKARKDKGDVDGDSWSAPPNEDITSQKTITVGAGKGYNENRGRLSRYGNQLAAQLADLKSEKIARTKFQKSGKLDSRRLSRGAMGNQRIFYKPGEEVEVDIAASVVLDISESMQNYRKQLRDASIVSQVAMEKLNIAHEIWGFSGGYGHEADHYEYKSFGRDEARGLGRIANPHDDVAGGNGSTPTTQAVNFCTARLRRRREGNRVMFVFTDGQPNDKNGTIKAVKNARAKGVTVLGILFEGSKDRYGFGSSNREMMSNIFGGDYVAIKDLNDFPMAVGKRLKKLLRIRS